MPLLGLFAWNVRHLALVVAERAQRTKTVKLNPYVAEKLQRWSAGWQLDDARSLLGESWTLSLILKYGWDGKD